MSSFCQDRDILGIEPIAYLGSGFSVAQELIASNDGIVSSTTFSSAALDIGAVGIEAGMVLCAYTTEPSDGAAWEVISVDSATAITVSILRSDVSDDLVAPPAGSGLSFYVRTFGARIANVSQMLEAKLQTFCEANPTATAEFADTSQLRMATAYGVLTGIFKARADSAHPNDINWVKAEYYRNEFLRLRATLQIKVDSNGDGVFERTLTLGNTTFKRI